MDLPSNAKPIIIDEALRPGQKRYAEPDHDEDQCPPVADELGRQERTAMAVHDRDRCRHQPGYGAGSADDWDRTSPVGRGHHRSTADRAHCRDDEEAPSTEPSGDGRAEDEKP